MIAMSNRIGLFRILAYAFVGGMLLAACSSDRSPDAGDRTIQVDGQAVAASSLRQAVTGLCTALERLPIDPTAARRAFYDLSHDRLHTIAAAVQDIDRPAATSLLNAKAVVEEDLARFPFPSSLAADLDRLAAASRAALRVLSVPAEPC